ncbi:hypothetical protein K501DRAFT_235814, partial [Backusella circina FSU 941]
MYRRRLKKKEDKPEIPNNLTDFGYVLKDNGEVRSITRDEPYVFDYLPKDRPYNEKRYKVFINLIGDVVEERLQKEPYHYQKMTIPLDADPTKDVHTFIFMTPNALTTTDKLLVMIPGNHTRIGQWSRRIMCDENIERGSMMEITKRVQEKGYECIILNPNGIFWYDDKPQDTPPIHTTKITTVPENDTPEMHTEYVFKHVISKAKAEKIAFMALGWGGHGLTMGLNNEFDHLKNKIKAAAFLDSSHSRDFVSNVQLRNWMFERALNWVVSGVKRGEVVQDLRFGCTCISSEQEIADFTLPSCLEDILKFIFIKMGDVEPDEINEEDEEQGDPENGDRELTQEEQAELSEHLNVISVE